MEQQEFDTLKNMYESALLKILNTKEDTVDASLIYEFVTSFKKLYNLPETGIFVYRTFLSGIEIIPGLIYDKTGAIDLSYAIGALEKVCQSMGDDESSRKLIIDGAKLGLLKNAKNEGFVNGCDTFEETNWYKLVIKWENEAKKLGWDGKYSNPIDIDTYFKDSELLKGYHMLSSNYSTMPFAEINRSGAGFLANTLSSFVDENPNIKCKNALYALYSLSSVNDASDYSVYYDRYSDPEEISDEIIDDLLANDYYNKAQGYMLACLLITLGNKTSAEVSRPMVYSCLENALSCEKEGDEVCPNVGYSFAAYAVLSDFMYWFKRINVGEVEGNEHIVLKEVSDDNKSEAVAEENDKYEALVDEYNEPQANDYSETSNNTSHDTDYDEFNKDNAKSLSKGLAWGLPLFVILIFCTCTLFLFPIGVLIFLISCCALEKKFCNIMFEENKIVIRNKDFNEAVAYIKSYLKSKHFRSVDGECAINFHKGLGDRPFYGINFYDLKENPDLAVITICVSNVTCKRGTYPRGFFQSLRFKDNFTKELTEKFGV